MSRMVFVITGWLAVGLGLIGVILPILPTTPFMILAAFCFARGSPRARAWLVDRSRFGAHITVWEEEGAIAPAAKRLAVTVMALVFVASIIFMLPWWVILIQAICMGPAAAFILTRPDPQR